MTKKLPNEQKGQKMHQNLLEAVKKGFFWPIESQKNHKKWPKAARSNQD